MDYKTLKNGQVLLIVIFSADFYLQLIALRNPLISNSILTADNSEAFVSNKILHQC
jgi:hypothetical protein